MVEISEHPDATKTSPEPKEPTFKIDVAEMQAARRAQWKGAIQQELQECVQQAADIRKKITDAKTQYKKDFYGKKFAKIQAKVMQMVGALQRMEMQEGRAAAPQLPPQPPPAQAHVHDENCQHDHGDESESTPSSTS